jgi:hypothetical protein
MPMVRVLFQQLATPANLPVGLDEQLDWTDDVLARVDRRLFFQRFEAAAAVQYFYEPFPSRNFWRNAASPWTTSRSIGGFSGSLPSSSRLPARAARCRVTAGSSMKRM